MRCLTGLLLFAVAAAAAAGDPFRPLRLPSKKRVEKEIVPRLPSGIVIESGPFDTLIRRLLEPYAEQQARRRAAIGELDAAKLKAAFKVMAKENAELKKRIAGVEAEYAAVYNRGYMESGEKARRARKLAAVLVPFYRTLLLRNAGIAARARPKLLDASDPELRAAAVGALARTGTDAALAAVRKALAADAFPVVRVRALEALLLWKVAAVKDAVIAALQDRNWQVRALAIAICVRANLVEAAGPLIEALGEEQGRLRKDIDDALFRLTGTRLYGDVGLWQDWWRSNADGIAKRARELEKAGQYDKALGPLGDWEEDEAEAGADETKRKGATSAFYGITTQSKRLVFVIDISRSMNDPAQAKPAATTGKKDPYRAPRGDRKLDIAKWQLHRAIQDLPKDAVFNVVVYSESYKVWVNELVAATPRYKRKAHRFVDQLNGNGTTNIGDSLDAALEHDTDTVYLLSDGNPNRGRLSDLDKLLAHLLERNRLARRVVHTIGIGEAEGSSFLKELARRTGGRYVGFR
ncbi:MAG: VWA domain-containing protein [Planctomycetota bacterium]|jgi:HEAT repeat protein